MRTFFRRIKNYYFYDMKIEHKLLLSHLALSLLAVLSLTILMLLNFSRTLQNKLLSSAEATSDKILLSVENIIQKYDNMTYTFSMLDTVTDLFTHAESGDYEYTDIYNDRNHFERSLFSCIPMQIRHSVTECTVRVYFDNRFPYFNDRTRYFTYRDIDESDWYSRIMEQYAKDRSSFYLVSSEELSTDNSTSSSFAMMRVIPDSHYYPAPLAIIRLDFPANYMNNAIDMNGDNASGNTGQAVTFLVSQETGKLLAVSDPSQAEIFSLYIEPGLSGSSVGWHSYKLNGTEYYILSQDSSTVPVTLITMLPKKSLFSEYYLHRNFTLALGIFLLLICIIISSFLAKNMSIRIFRLSSSMKQVQRGKLIELPPALIHGSDEIGVLTESYQYMIHSMKQMIAREYELGQETKKAELKALQAQINPHFLYNALDLIQWFAEEGMLPQLKDAISSLATFYRLSLSNGKEMISLTDEITHVRSYIRLQELRFPHMFLYEEHIDSVLLGHLIPKTTLQPLIENAILHGIQESDKRPGHLWLCVKKQDADIEITIEDDGIGLPDTPEVLLSPDYVASRQDHGFGLYNISSRLRLIYGEGYGLQLSSRTPQGTIVRVILPGSR